MKLLLLSILLLPVMAMCQREYKIVSELAKEGRTVWYWSKSCDSELWMVVRIRWYGLAKKPDVIGRVGRYYPNGYGKRKVCFILFHNKVVVCCCYFFWLASSILGE